MVTQDAPSSVKSKVFIDQLEKIAERVASEGAVAWITTSYLFIKFPQILSLSSIGVIVGLPDLILPILLPCGAGWDSNP